jgi:hypothetical protein
MAELLTLRMCERRQQDQQRNDPEDNPQQEIFVLFHGSGGANLVDGQVVSLCHAQEMSKPNASRISLISQ